MTHIFVFHALEDAHCAENIRSDLEAKGYTTWRQPANLQMSDVLYPNTIETIILGSVAVILLWSSDAAQSKWIEQQVLFAQRLHKIILLVSLDSTILPNILVFNVPVLTNIPCADIIMHLLQQPLLPAPQSSDPLFVLCEQATHEFIRERITTLLGVLFAITVLSNNFPPPYLKGNDNQSAKVMIIVSLVSFMFSIGASLLVTQVRSYPRYYNQRKNAEQLKHMINYKFLWNRVANLLFALGAIALACLLIIIIWTIK